MNALPYADPRYPALKNVIARIPNRSLGGIQARSDLHNAKFNGCIIEWKGEVLMCYRAYSKKLGGKSCIFVSRLNKEYGILSNHELDLPAYGAYRQYEDARLFTYAGELYVSYVVVQEGTQWVTAIHVAKLDDAFSVTAHFVTQYENNWKRGLQKNWLYFERDGQLYVTYDVTNSHTVALNADFQPITHTQSETVHMYCGDLRGGTGPIEDAGELFWVGHGSMSHPTRKRRYYMVPYWTEKEPPFAITHVGEMTFASLENGHVQKDAAWWLPIVVFPMGIIDRGDSWHVSAGINDLFTWVISMDKNMPRKSADEFRNIEPRYYRFDVNKKYPGEYRVLRVSGMTGTIGVTKCTSAKDIGLTENLVRVPEQITKEQYESLINSFK